MVERVSEDSGGAVIDVWTSGRDGYAFFGFTSLSTEVRLVS